MKPATEVLVESLLIAALNVVAVYLAAFVYGLNWSGILTVMVLASILTAGMSHYLLPKAAAKLLKDTPLKGVVEDGLAVLAIALFSSLAVLIILSYRFNLPMALGISLLSGILSALIRRLLAAA